MLVYPLMVLLSLVLPPLLRSLVGLGLGTNALYDLIKEAVVKKGPKKHVKITQLDQPDGTHLLIFDEEEK